MSAVRLLFCTNPRSPVSWLIRTGCWSRWSHVAIIDGDTIIEAIGHGGVVRSKLADRQRANPRWEIAEVGCTDPRAVIAAASSQIGKPYDYTAVLGLGVRREWQADDSWFCSELVAWAFERAGMRLFRGETLHRVTPQHLWMVPPVAEQRLAAEPA